MAEKITMEEYNRQKDEYTNQALKELQTQMQNQKPITRKILVNNKDDNNELSDDGNNSVILHNSDSDNDSDNDSNDDDNYETNLIIKHIINNGARDDSKTNSKLRNRRMKSIPDNETKASASINDIIYAQRELDMKTIQSLKEIINNLKREIDDESRKNHFLKLDLNNSHCDNMELKNQILVLKEETNKQNNMQNKRLLEYKNNIFRYNIAIIVAIVLITLLAFIN
jgi:hypothetical protein